VTGEKVPDDMALVPQWRYLNPHQAEWPAADFIVGNPPFIGAGWMRTALGDGYTEALRASWPTVPESADLVMYWWHHAAEAVRCGHARRFGLITTNSLRQSFNRRVVEAHQHATPPLRLAFVVPDHPWVAGAEGAAVRIAMSVGVLGSDEGRLLTATDEQPSADGSSQVFLQERVGHIHADLRIGANLAAAVALRANGGLSSPGVKLHGAGFIVTRAEAAALGLGTVLGIERHIREYRNGRDLTSTPRDVLVVDLFGLTADEVRTRFPSLYQWVRDRVKPERDASADKELREKWWLFRRTNRVMRGSIAGQPRYIATVETAKHRAFQFLDATVLPDNKLIAIALDHAVHLGVLSSYAHVEWSLATGARLEDRPVYVKTTCFERFPFPADDTGLTPNLAERIRQLAEQLDAHRKARQAAYDDVTLTGLYNVLTKLRSGEPLSAKDKLLHEHGLVSVLRSLHDELDSAVLQAYGWGDLQSALADHTPAAAEARAAAVDTLLERLVALNAKRAAEEAAGTVRWLRPDFQQRASAGTQAMIDVGPDDADEASEVTNPLPIAAAPKRPWPTGLPEQIKTVAELLAAHARPIALAELEARFSARGRWRERLPVILETLEALGRARRLDDAVQRWQAA
jgi:hypothetical protein